MEIDERLIEQNYGIYEGVDRNDAVFLNNKRNFAYRYPCGEFMMQVAYRVYGLLEKYNVYKLFCIKILGISKEKELRQKVTRK